MQAHSSSSSPLLKPWMELRCTLLKGQSDSLLRALGDSMATFDRAIEVLEEARAPEKTARQRCTHALETAVDAASVFVRLVAFLFAGDSMGFLPPVWPRHQLSAHLAQPLMATRLSTRPRINLSLVEMARWLGRSDCTPPLAIFRGCMFLAVDELLFGGSVDLAEVWAVSCPLQMAPIGPPPPYTPRVTPRKAPTSDGQAPAVAPPRTTPPARTQQPPLAPAAGASEATPPAPAPPRYIPPAQRLPHAPGAVGAPEATPPAPAPLRYMPPPASAQRPLMGHKKLPHKNAHSAPAATARPAPDPVAQLFEAMFNGSMVHEHIDHEAVKSSCRNGPTCKFYQQGYCHFRHD